MTAILKSFIFLLLLGISHVTLAQQGLFNPSLGDGADPWITKASGNYYLCQSVNVGNVIGISVAKSDKLSKRGRNIMVWQAPKAGWNSGRIWAPELHHIGNKWYIYYAAGKSGPPFIYQRSGVLESVTDDPQGRYIDKGILKTGTDANDYAGTIWAIDLTVGYTGKQLYAVWSGWEQNVATDKTQQNLYIAKMANPWTISSERVKISSPVEPWETGGPLNLNEGPEFLQHDGQVFIIYSTRESWTPAYRLGQLKLIDSNRSLLDSANWQKSGPVFEGTDDVYGVGHASFVTSPDDKQWWIIYHTKKAKADGWQREIRLQPFTFKLNGDPDFDKPVSHGKLIPLPSGEKN